MLVIDALVIRALERVSPQREQFGQSKRDEWLLPHVEAMRPLLHEDDLPLAVAERSQVAVVRPIEKLLAWPLFGIAAQVRQQIVAVEMHLEGLPAGFVPLEALLLDVRFARSCKQCRKPVLVRSDLIADRAGLDHARPPDRARHPIAA